jgi:hypothetical protein
MLRQELESLCRAAVAEAAETHGSTWTLFDAECHASSTTCSAYFAKRGEKVSRIDVSLGHKMDEAIKAERVGQLAAL